MSWDDVFQEFKYRHQFFLEKLKFNKDTIRQEIADVESDIESANTITQKILQLQEYLKKETTLLIVLHYGFGGLMAQ